MIQRLPIILSLMLMLNVALYTCVKQIDEKNKADSIQCQLIEITEGIQPTVNIYVFKDINSDAEFEIAEQTSLNFRLKYSFNKTYNIKKNSEFEYTVTVPIKQQMIVAAVFIGANIMFLVGVHLRHLRLICIQNADKNVIKRD